mmetsp:Transcript_18485/g.55193  ORF Transcript_18485/g.55193 Transcript_18485/m.55193 type:complete len:220 (+) Transcript_18485:470-1129(+)
MGVSRAVAMGPSRDTVMGPSRLEVMGRSRLEAMGHPGTQGSCRACGQLTPAESQLMQSRPATPPSPPSLLFTLHTGCVQLGCRIARLRVAACFEPTPRTSVRSSLGRTSVGSRHGRSSVGSRHRRTHVVSRQAGRDLYAVQQYALPVHAAGAPAAACLSLYGGMAQRRSTPLRSIQARREKVWASTLSRADGEAVAVRVASWARCALGPCWMARPPAPC